MNETVKLILSLSLSGSILAVLIFAVEPFIKQKFSKSIQYYIWIVVLLRLALPFSFEESIMNELFYGNQTPIITTSHSAAEPVDILGENILNSHYLSIAKESVDNVKENAANGANNADVDYGKYFKDLFNQYIFYLWLMVVMIILLINLTGYTRFLKLIKKGNKPADDEENRALAYLLKGRNKIKLVRNPFVTTPMLIGIIKPYIIIPDIDFNEKQLKNILRHEIVHFKRFDIAVKWLVMIVTAIHWFNPLMYFIKKEINHACELSCDEAAIKNLSSSEKQAYGDTLISMAAEHEHSKGVLQVTMCEEKRNLKERLVSIMNHNKKSKLIIIFSIILLGFVIFGALYLGAGVKNNKDSPPNLYISAAEQKTKVAITGSYNWSYAGKHTNADSDNPVNFKYNSDNIVSVMGKQQLSISIEKLKLDKQYNFTIEQVSLYTKDKQPVEFDKLSSKPRIMNGNLYMQAPSKAGEYIYTLSLNFKDRGTVNYGFVVRVDMLTYDLNEISKYKTPYVGDSSKVSNMVRHLPVPDNYFKQQYISLLTGYGLNVFYEAKKGVSHSSEWPIVNSNNSVTYSNMRKNALVLFCMINNLDKVTFAFRDSQSEGKLDEAQYDTKITFSRASVEEKYGDLSVLGKNLDLIQDGLTGKISETKDSKDKFSDEERKRIDLYVTIMKETFKVENGGNKFVAVKLDTLKDLNDIGKAEVLKKLTTLSPNVYNFDEIKNDNSKFKIDNSGRLERTIDGTLLYLQVEEYSENRAVVTGVSWFGNLGAVFPKYEATFENGSWKLKTVGFAIS